MSASGPDQQESHPRADDVEAMFSFAVYQSVIGFQLSKAADGLARALNTIIANKNLPLTAREFVILNLLYEESPLSQMQLVERSYKDAAATSRLVTSLHRKGMVARVKTPADKRIKLISLTDQGKAARGVIIPALSAMLRSTLQGASDEDLRATQRVIQQVIGATLDAST